MAAGRDVEHLAVLGHRSPGDRITGVVEPGYQFLVGERAHLVLVADEFHQLLLHHLVCDFLVRLVVPLAAAEEALQGEDAARRLHPLVVHGPAHGGDVNLYQVGDLLHFERMNVLGAGIEEGPLMVDDGRGDAQQRVPPLLDTRLHQPISRLEFLAKLVADLVVEILIPEQFDGPLADADFRDPFIAPAGWS